MTDANAPQAHEETFEEFLSDYLKVPIVRLSRTAEPPTYHFEFARIGKENVVVSVRAEKLLNQGVFRGAVFAEAGFLPRKIGARERPTWEQCLRTLANWVDRVDV